MDQPEPAPDALFALFDNAKDDDELRCALLDRIRHELDPQHCIEFYISALKDSCWRIRALSAHAMYDLAHDGEEAKRLLVRAVGPLADALSDEDPNVALNAAYTLELLGPLAGGAIP